MPDYRGDVTVPQQAGRAGAALLPEFESIRLLLMAIKQGYNQLVWQRFAWGWRTSGTGR